MLYGGVIAFLLGTLNSLERNPRVSQSNNSDYFFSLLAIITAIGIPPFLGFMFKFLIAVNFMRICSWLIIGLIFLRVFLMFMYLNIIFNSLTLIRASHYSPNSFNNNLKFKLGGILNFLLTILIVFSIYTLAKEF